MASFLSQFTPAQLDLIEERCTITERQGSSTTGEIVTGDEFGEFYIDDPNALFRTNQAQAGDIVEISAGTSPVGEYTVAGLYFDPAIEAVYQVASETRLIVDGFPVTGGPITYRVLAPTPILEELANIIQNKAEILNVINPELQVQDDAFMVFLNKFDVVNNLVSSVGAWMRGLDRTRITPEPPSTLLDDSALGTMFTALFPQGYFDLNPNRTQITGTPPYPVDLFVVPSSVAHEQEGKDDEVAADPPSPGPGLDAPYAAALNKQDTALDSQDNQWIALQAEIADNDQTTESGDLNLFYTAMSSVIATQRSSIALRKQDIADMFSQNRPRSTASGLNFSSFGALQAELDARFADLSNAVFQKFLDLRYPYLDLVINRGYGTRTQLVSNTQQIAINDNYRQTLIDERETDRDLLELP